MRGSLLLPVLTALSLQCTEEQINDLLLPQASVKNKPLVISTNPLDGRMGFDPNEEIWILFGVPMDEQQTQTAFSLRSDSGVISGTFRWEAQKMYFIPKDPIIGTGEYVMTISRQAESISGQDLKSDFIVRFFPNADTTKPVFVSSTPAAGETNVDPATSIVLRFSEGISFSSIASGIQVSPSFLSVIQQNASREEITIVPQSPLATGTIYTVNINSNLKDLSGNPLLTDKNFTFVVGADFDQPAITGATMGAVTFTDGVTTNGAEKAAALVFDFSEAMDQVSTEAAFSLTPAVARTITWNAGFTTMTVTPLNALESESNYTASIGAGARDQAGNSIIQSYSYPFYTDGANSIRPAIVEVRQEDSNYTGPSCDGNAGLATYSMALADFSTLNTGEQMDEDPAGGSTICVITLRITFNNNMVLTSLLDHTTFTKIFDGSGGNINIWSIALTGNVMTLKLQGVPFPGGGAGTPLYRLGIKGGTGGVYDINNNLMQNDYALYLVF